MSYNKTIWKSKDIITREKMQKIEDQLEVLSEQEASGSGSGTSDYLELENKPQINGVTLTGNKSLTDLGAAAASDVAAKYTKPGTGIPASDLSSTVQASLNKADTALQGENLTSAVNNYLETNFSNPSNPPLDRTLSSSASAAPADMVGELKSAINQTKDDVVELTREQFNVGGEAISQNIPIPGDNGFYTVLTIDLKPNISYTFYVEITQAITEKTVYVYLLDTEGHYIGANGNIFGVTPGNTHYSKTLTLSASYNKVRLAVRCQKPFTVKKASATYDIKNSPEYSIPDYYFTDGWLDAKIARINELAKEAGSDGDVFIFITDSHLTQNVQHAPALINYVMQRTNIHRLFDGGDAYNGGSMDYQKTIRKAFDGKCYFAMGNHEYSGQRTGSALYYMYDSVNDDQIGNPERHYYFVDDKQTKTRYIVLSAFDEMETPTSGASEGYETDQVTWFENVALNVESGWTIIVITHAVYYGNFTTHEWYLLNFAEPIVDAIDNYSGNGTIAFVLQGHLHADGLNTTSGGVPVIATTCDKQGHWIYQDTDMEPFLNKRVVGTVTEQAFDVVIHNKKAKKVNLVRIGGFATFNGEGIDELNAAGEREISYNSIPCEGISLNKSTTSLTSIGATETLTATVTPAGTTDQITWSVTGSAVSVNNGVITAVQVGSATVTVTCGGYSDTCTVTVTNELDYDWDLASTSGKTSSGYTQHGSNSVNYGGFFSAESYSGTNKKLVYNTFSQDYIWPIMLSPGTTSLVFDIPSNMRATVFWTASEVGASQAPDYASFISGDASAFDSNVPLGERTVTVPSGADSFVFNLQYPGSGNAMTDTIIEGITVTEH